MQTEQDREQQRLESNRGFLFKDHDWPQSYRRRSDTFKHGYTCCRQWLLDGISGTSINPHDDATASHDAWEFGWSESFRLLELQSYTGVFISLRQVVGLTDAGKERFRAHLELYGDPALSSKDHYLALVSVINSQLAGLMVSRQPPWLWEPSAPEGKDGGCYSYCETDLVLEVKGATEMYAGNHRD